MEFNSGFKGLSNLYINFITRIQNGTQVIKIFHIFEGKIIDF